MCPFCHTNNLNELFGFIDVIQTMPACRKFPGIILFHYQHINTELK